ncbi:MAG: tetratricopeptide repeat protein [Candidatus Melainabacteria bacterium]|nr:tetratricopeptide repeat protein [Candidatus Melainabacteria bacterium]
MMTRWTALCGINPGGLEATSRSKAMLTLWLVLLVASSLPQSEAVAAPKAAKRPAASATQLGIAKYNKGYIRQAIPLFQQGVKQQPNSADAHLWLARSLRKQGGAANFQAAARAYERVVALSPDNVEALSALAEIRSWNIATRDQAVEYYRRAYALAPNRADIAKSLSQVLSWSRQYEDALRIGEPVAEQFTKDKTWRAEYAFVLTKNHRSSDAIAIYENELNVKQSSQPNVLEGYAAALIDAMRYAEARTVYQQLKPLVEKLPADKKPPHHLAMAGLAYELAEYNDALAWDQTLPESMLSEDTSIALRMARTLAKLNRPTEATQVFYNLYQAGKLSSNEKIEFADYLIDSQIPSSSLPEAGLIEKLYREAMAENPGQAGYSIRMARFYSKDSTRFEEANRLYLQGLAESNSPEVRQEYVDFLKSAASIPGQPVGEAFTTLAGQFPNDPVIQGGYADYLSWSGETRAESLKIYLSLLKTDTERRSQWETSLTQVLEWHTPEASLVPLYQEVLELSPNNRMALRSLARVYWNEPGKFDEAQDIYLKLVEQYPEDGLFAKEWAELLASTEGMFRRQKAVESLEILSEKYPENPGVWVAYGKLTSYMRRYGTSIKAFDKALALAPDFKDAILGKGNTLLWSGQKYAAKKYLLQAHEQFPEDTQITLALAEAERAIGRYDNAIDLLEIVKQQRQQQGIDLNTPNTEKPAPSSSSSLPKPGNDFLAGGSGSSALTGGEAQDTLQQNTLLADTLLAEGIATSPKAGMADDLDILDRSLESLKLLQERSKQDLENLEKGMKEVQATVPAPLPPETVDVHQPVDFSSVHLSTEMMNSAYTHNGTLLNGRAESLHTATQSSGNNNEDTNAYIQQALATQGNTRLGQRIPVDDSGSLLSGRGTLYRDAYNNLEFGLSQALRPEIRSGFLYLDQKGDDTTTSVKGPIFLNQVGMSLSPQTKVRFGVTPRRLFLPEGPNPRSTWAWQYSLGATTKPLDHWQFDGDIALTSFSQSDTWNLTYQANAAWEPTDRWRFRFGARRVPLENSLLSYAGIKPSAGRFSGDLVGQVRENQFFAEASYGPFWKYFDFNTGYEWAFTDGSNTPTNYKNQAYGSLGFSHNIGQNHSGRLGLETLYFGYSRNATNGFYDPTGQVLGPAASLVPPGAAPAGTVFGGYYSPEFFLLSNLRADIRGHFFNRFLEYKVGGTIGVQFQDAGIANVSEPTSLATAFDALVIMNFTSWLAAYGSVDFLDAGGVFRRWRYGGGLIVRPAIDGLSPLFGKRP